MRKISLPLITAAERNRVLIWGAIVFAFVYSVLGECLLGQATYLPLTVADKLIPLWPWTLLVYLSDYPFVLFVILRLKDAEDFSIACYRMIAGILMTFAVFLIFPTIYPRPAVPIETFWSDIFSLLHLLDLPTNCFPSLHVSITLISALSLTKLPLKWRWFGWIWAVAICLSTLTTKQHYLLDVLGGIFVTLASAWLTQQLTLTNKSKRLSGSKTWV